MTYLQHGALTENKILCARLYYCCRLWLCVHVFLGKMEATRQQTTFLLQSLVNINLTHVLVLLINFYWLRISLQSWSKNDTQFWKSIFQCCCHQGKSLSSRILWDQFSSPCPCPQTISPCPCPRPRKFKPSKILQDWVGCLCQHFVLG